jgi:hypothetical protein
MEISCRFVVFFFLTPLRSRCSAPQGQKKLARWSDWDQLDVTGPRRALYNETVFTKPGPCRNDPAVALGLGRTVALHHRSSTSYRMH